MRRFHPDRSGWRQEGHSAVKPCFNNFYDVINELDDEQPVAPRRQGVPPAYVKQRGNGLDCHGNQYDGKQLDDVHRPLAHKEKKVVEVVLKVGTANT